MVRVMNRIEIEHAQTAERDFLILNELFESAFHVEEEEEELFERVRFDLKSLLNQR
jgi:hypothetical protein